MPRRKTPLILAVLIMLLLVHGSVFAAVSYLGPAGTYTEEAAAKYFGIKERLLPFKTVQESLKELLTAKADYAVVPVENTIGGATAYGPLVTDEFNYVIVGEIILPIRQTLLGVRGAQLGDVQTVLSHPQGIAQSTVWLKANLPQAKVVEVSSTAEGSKRVAETGDKSIAAIAASRTAGVYNLDILANDLQYTNTNVTRFWVVATQNRLATKGNKATLLVEGDVQKLHRLLAIFDREGLNVVTVRDYPSKAKLGQYKFLIEVVNQDTKDKKSMTEALIKADQQQKKAFKIRIIGIYDQAEDWLK